MRDTIAKMLNHCMSLNCMHVFKVIRTPDVDSKDKAERLCSIDSSIYQYAEKYCTKDSDCNSPTIEVKFFDK